MRARMEKYWDQNFDSLSEMRKKNAREAGSLAGVFLFGPRYLPTA